MGAALTGCGGFHQCILLARIQQSNFSLTFPDGQQANQRRDACRDANFIDVAFGYWPSSHARPALESPRSLLPSSRGCQYDSHRSSACQPAAGTRWPGHPAAAQTTAPHTGIQLLHTLLLLALCTVTSLPSVDTVVVCPARFQETLMPWLEYRESQGHRIAVIPGRGSAEEIRRAIAARAAGGKLRFVLIVGDATASPAVDALDRTVPTFTVPAQVNVLWGSEPEIGTDNRYGDLDGDGVPELAVGRIPADSPAELRGILGRVIAYETSREFGPWRRRVSFIAGVGGFGALADTAVELTAGALIRGTVPAAYGTTMTYASWRSVYCPDPLQFRATTLARLNEGCFFWVYMGHGRRQGLDQLPFAGLRRSIFDRRDVPRLRCRADRRPIVAMMACYAGAFDAQEDCLAEEMLRHAGGPVAVLAASRVTMPYGMAVLGSGLLHEVFERHAATLGEAVLKAKQSMFAVEPPAGASRNVLDLLAKTLTPGPVDLAAERTEHVRMFNLIGDPLLRLHYPQTVQINVPASSLGGTKLVVRGTCPVDGQATVELLMPNGRHLRATSPGRHGGPQSRQDLAAWQAVYRRANDPRLSTATCRVEKGRFATRLSVPSGAKGACCVRVYVAGADEFALGAVSLKVQRGETLTLR